jgi:hypothetical protein
MAKWDYYEADFSPDISCSALPHGHSVCTPQQYPSEIQNRVAVFVLARKFTEKKDFDASCFTKRVKFAG